MRTFAKSLLILIAASLASPGPAQASDTPSGPVVLTIAGAVPKPDRGPLDAFTDAYFNFQQKEFNAARGFTWTQLASLPQMAITAHAESWKAPIDASGPTLEAVLAAAGISDDATIALVAIDGYTIELDAVARKSRSWVLAIQANGTPLAIGGRGPAWLLHDTGDTPASDDEEAKWVWSVLLIEAR